MAYFAMQHGRNGRLPRQSLENFKAALERPHFAVRELADAAFERGVGRRRAVQALASLLGQPKREAAAIVGIGLAINEARADQSVDCAADGGGAPLSPFGGLGWGRPPRG